jgi:hypothetical protein
MRTIQEMAEEANLVQDACNLSGVVHSFSRIMSELCEMGLDTETRNRHPIVRAYVSKLVSLSRYDMGDDTFEALNKLIEK